MFTLVGKVSIGAAAASCVAGLVHVGLTGDRSGYVLLLAVALGFALVSIGSAVYAAPPPFMAVDDVAETALPVDTTDTARSSPWPLAVALAVGLTAAGAATEPTLAGIGVVAIVLASLAWLGQAWQEHPAWTAAMTERLNERFVIPFVLPALVVVLVGISVVSFSRVLLAVSKTAAWIIALIVAVALLGSLVLIASRERVGSAALKVLAAFAGVLLIAAGVTGTAVGEREFHHLVEEGHYSITADGLRFNINRLRVPAASDVSVELVNRDDVAHTFSVYVRDGGDVIFEGDDVASGTTHEYTFETPATEGQFWFQCDIHPDTMFGTFVVEQATAETDSEGDSGEHAIGARR